MQRFMFDQALLGRAFDIGSDRGVFVGVCVMWFSGPRLRAQSLTFGISMVLLGTEWCYWGQSDGDNRMYGESWIEWTQQTSRCTGNSATVVACYPKLNILVVLTSLPCAWQPDLLSSQSAGFHHMMIPMHTNGLTIMQGSMIVSVIALAIGIFFFYLILNYIVVW